MKKVLIVCPYPRGKAPSQRFRFEQYLDTEGVNFTQASFWNEDEWPRIYEEGSIQYKVLSTMKGFGRRLGLLLRVRQFDKVFVHREATPIGPPWFEWAVVKLFKKPLIFDFDDAIWLPNSSKANEKLAGKWKFHGKTAKICAWATTVVAGNAFLADYAKQYCTDVRIIPTTIDTEYHHNPDLYTRANGKWTKTLSPFGGGGEERVGGGPSNPKKDNQQSTDSINAEKRLTAKGQGLTANPNAFDQTNPTPLNPKEPQHDTITIGWTGTHSTLKQLTPLYPLLEEVHREIPFRFLLIADVPPDSMPDFVEFRKWSKETEIEDLLELEIGVMPLYATDWERGKCGFKALQYQALGIPAVVSDVGVNAEVVVEGVTGLICESLPTEEAKRWRENLSVLLKDAKVRTDLGKKARLHVVEVYSVASQKKAFADLM